MYDFQIVLYPCRVDALTEDIKGLNEKLIFNQVYWVRDVTSATIVISSQRR